MYQETSKQVQYLIKVSRTVSSSCASIQEAVRSYAGAVQGPDMGSLVHSGDKTRGGGVQTAMKEGDQVSWEGPRGSRNWQLRCTGPRYPGCKAYRSAVATVVRAMRAGAPAPGGGRSAAHRVYPPKIFTCSQRTLHLHLQRLNSIQPG